MQNAHGDVVNLTDADGAVTKTYHYDAFGVEKNIVASDANAFRYCGEYFDAETGTIYLRARYYNPTTGRFISRDSYAGDNNDPLSLNLYTYCHNNPIIGTDPTGHWLNIAIGAVAGAVLGAASVAITGGDWKSIAIAAAGGAISGGLAATGLGVVGTAIANGIIGGAQTALESYVHGKEISMTEVAVSGIFNGALSYASGAKGALSGLDDAAKSSIYRAQAGVEHDLSLQFTKWLNPSKNSMNTSGGISDAIMSNYVKNTETLRHLNNTMKNYMMKNANVKNMFANMNLNGSINYCNVIEQAAMSKVTEIATERCIETEKNIFKYRSLLTESS